MRTSTVEAVIREAEARERALAAETAAITLDGADWQAQVAASLSGSIQADSMSSFAAKGPSFTKQKQGDAQVLSLELPADDFKGLNAAGQRLPRDMVQQQPRGPGPAHRVPGPAPGLLMPDRPPTSEHAPGMSRYGAHRVR